MSDITADSDDFAGILSARAQAEAQDRQRNIRRGIAAGAVLLVHILALIVIAYSNRIPLIARIKETVPEAILWIPMPQPAVHPKKPVPQQTRPEETLPPPTAPITLPPRKPQPLAPPSSEGLRGVGRSLSCAATNYENLSPTQREQCIRHPWAFIKRPDGTIVLDAPNKAPPPPAFTGGDLARHEQQTAPPCPVLQNVPCLSKVLPNHDQVTNGSGY